MALTKATLIPPGVGRIVHFIHFDVTTQQHDALPEAAIITAVHGDRCINCQTFGADGRNNNYSSMTLLQPGDVAPERDYCRWMEYQIGQAQKAAELQRTIAEFKADLLPMRTEMEAEVAALEGKADADERDAKSEG